jgi:hypothetical protein
MHIVRALCSGVVLAGLGSFGLAILPGCGDDNPPSGTTVKADPAADAKRQQNIEQLYKSNPPGKGPAGQLPPTAAKK